MAAACVSVIYSPVSGVVRTSAETCPVACPGTFRIYIDPCASRESVYRIKFTSMERTYVSKIVPSFIFADLRVERSLDNISSFEVGFPESRLLVAWIAWQKLCNIATCGTSAVELEDTTRCMAVQWSKCQWLRIKALTSSRLSPPSFKISVTSFWIRSPGI